MKKYWLIIAISLPFNLQSQIISTITGTGGSTFSGEGVNSVLASTPNPIGGVFDKNGNYYFADGQNSHRIRKISTFGVISTVAGNGLGSYSGDSGPATAASLNSPGAVKFDTAGNMLIVDLQNNRIRKVDAITGIITTIAGNGTGAYNGDNIPATSATIWAPQDICVDKLGNIYIADAYNARIRKIDVTGTITTYAGTGVAGFGGDNGPATNAQIALPTGLAVDDTGNLYIADNSNASNRVRKVSVSGIIKTIAGNGTANYLGDGILASTAQISPSKIAIDSFNNLFIGDRYNNRIYKVGVTNILQNIAGNGIVGDGGDGGPAAVATLNYPSGVSIDACGNLYIPVTGSVAVLGSGRRIRKVTFNPPTTPSLSISGITTASVGATVTVNATVSGAGSAYTIKWMNKGVQFATTSVPTVTYTKAAGIDTITARIVPTITYCYDSTISAQHLVAVSSVGITEVGGMGGYSIFPNPAVHTLTVTGTEAVNMVVITNLLGQALLTEESGKNNVQVNIAHLPPGMYLIRVNDVWVRRFAKE